MMKFIENLVYPYLSAKGRLKIEVSNLRKRFRGFNDWEIAIALGHAVVDKKQTDAVKSKLKHFTKRKHT